MAANRAGVAVANFSAVTRTARPEAGKTFISSRSLGNPIGPGGVRPCTFAPGPSSFYRLTQVWAPQVMIHVSNGNYTARFSP